MESELPKLRGITIISRVMWAVAAVLVVEAIALLLVASKGALRYEAAAVCFTGTIAIGALAIGLGRRKPWAWDGTVLLGLLALVAFLLILALGVALAKVNDGEGMTTAVLGFVGVVPAIASLWYLLLAKTRRVFCVELYTTPAHPSVWIRLLACQSILSSVTYFGEVFKATSTVVLGVALSGIFQVMYAVTLGAVSLIVGYGLYQMIEAARRVAIGLAAFILADILRGLVQTWTMPFVVSSFPIGQPVMRFLTIGLGIGVSMIYLLSIAYLMSSRRDFSDAGRVEAQP